MSKIKIAIWTSGLFVCSFVWAQVMATAMDLHQPTGTINRIGVALGMSLPVFVTSGAFAGIAYFIKRRPNFAMWVWTFALLFSFAVLGIGAANNATKQKNKAHKISSLNGVKQEIQLCSKT